MNEELGTRLAQLRASTSALTEWLEHTSWSDAYAHGPSLMPGWTRGHVLTHVARNADGISRTVAGALRHEVLARYPDGNAAKQAAISQGATRPAIELFTDVGEANERLDRVLSAVADADGWQLPTAEGHVVSEWLVRRWREIEIHRVDLNADYAPADWPADFVGYLLTTVTRTLDDRAGELGPVEISADRVVLNVGEPGETTVVAPGWAVAAWLVGREGAAEPMRGVPPLLPWI